MAASPTKRGWFCPECDKGGLSGDRFRGRRDAEKHNKKEHSKKGKKP